MKLYQPYYIDKREGVKHTDLNGIWKFTYVDNAVEDLSILDFPHEAVLPASVFRCVQQAQILPDPYVGLNSKLYHWVDEKVWYFKRTFATPIDINNKLVYLSFEGVSYFCRVWLNGQLLGEHEGMFGGPVVEVSQYLNADTDNELVVEVLCANYGKKDSYNAWLPKAELIPWNVIRDTFTSNGDFVVLGIWNDIRLDVVEKMHISRPYLITESVENDRAVLDLSFELYDGTIKELRPFGGHHESENALRQLAYHECAFFQYTNTYTDGLSGKLTGESVTVRVELTEKESGKQVFVNESEEPLIYHSEEGATYIHHEAQFIERKIEVENPKLWYPTGLGSPFLYEATITLLQKGKVLDTLHITTGIRTVELLPTTGRRYRTRWEKFQFCVNGEKFFLKGMNWTPVDFLYDIKPEEYDWLLFLAKKAGIQLLRVWSGGGIPETDYFYKRCDELGIMVWQDHIQSNIEDTSMYNLEVMEAQEAYNVYRIRNHPSLVIHCGGNEFNPYHPLAAGPTFITTRTVRDLDPARPFHYTSPDRGSAHCYRDMETVWYRHIYRDVPFMAESGIHSFPNYSTLSHLISEKELNAKLTPLDSKKFIKEFPELLNHFAEYKPDRSFQLLTRVSQIIDINNISMRDLCEATQVQSYEFYTLMIDAMRDRYPVCAGVMPWVFARPWTTAGIQTIDGEGRPVLAYYAVQKAYEPLHLSFALQWSIIAPFEKVPLEVKINAENGYSFDGATLRVTVYNPDMSIAQTQAVTTDKKDTYVFDEFAPDEKFINRGFIICIDLERNCQSVLRNAYFVRCNDLLADKETYKKYRSAPTANITFTHGQLKPSLQKARKTALSWKTVGRGNEGKYAYVDMEVTNDGSVPAYPVTFACSDDKARFVADKNFFLLKPQETERVRITFEYSSPNALPPVTFTAWNVE